MDYRFGIDKIFLTFIIVKKICSASRICCLKLDNEKLNHRQFPGMGHMTLAGVTIQLAGDISNFAIASHVLVVETFFAFGL